MLSVSSVPLSSAKTSFRYIPHRFCGAEKTFRSRLFSVRSNFCSHFLSWHFHCQSSLRHSFSAQLRFVEFPLRESAASLLSSECRGILLILRQPLLAPVLHGLSMMKLTRVALATLLRQTTTSLRLPTRPSDDSPESYDSCEYHASASSSRKPSLSTRFQAHTILRIAVSNETSVRVPLFSGPEIPTKSVPGLVGLRAHLAPLLIACGTFG